MFQSPSSKRILRGYAQVFLQERAKTGFYIALAILWADFNLFLGSLLGGIVASLFAEKKGSATIDIEKGIYGFNGVLIGIATSYFFDGIAVVVGSIVIGAIASVYIIDFMKAKDWDFLTSPFVLVVWILLIVFRALVTPPVSNDMFFDNGGIIPFSAIAKSFSQVLLLNDSLSGILIIVGLLYAIRFEILYIVGAVVLSILLSNLISIPYEIINDGLVGFNVILCSLLFLNKDNYKWLYIIFSIYLCVLFQWIFFETHTIALTAPFLISSWIIIYLSKNFINPLKA